MLIRLITVGSKMPGWVVTGFEEYRKRLNKDVKLELVEIPLPARHKNADIGKAVELETKAILAAIGKTDWVVALDVAGQNWSTEVLAEQLERWKMQGSHVALLVGGPDGLSQQCLNLARQHWSLSRLTFPHPLVRILVAEQIYRAWSLINNHPYHRSG